MSHKITFDEKTVNCIVKRYIDGASAFQIASSYSMSVVPIYRILKEQNVIRRGQSDAARKYYLNEKYFDEIDTFDKAYFFGLLMADGYNSDMSIVITLSKKDLDILERFRIFINSERPIKHYFSKDGRFEYCKLALYSKYLSNRLTQLGCMRAKSLKIKFPERYLNGDLVRHFIRGYFDGDGCISCTFAKRDNYFGNSFLSVITFTSTEDFCLYLKKYFKDNFNIHSTLLCRHPLNNNNNRTLQISGNSQVIKIVQWMYKDTDLYLKRKYDKFIFICEKIKERNVVVSKMRSENGKKVMNNINKDRKTHVSSI